MGNEPSAEQKLQSNQGKKSPSSPAVVVDKGRPKGESASTTAAVVASSILSCSTAEVKEPAELAFTIKERPSSGDGEMGTEPTVAAASVKATNGGLVTVKASKGETTSATSSQDTDPLPPKATEKEPTKHLDAGKGKPEESSAISTKDTYPSQPEATKNEPVQRLVAGKGQPDESSAMDSSAADPVEVSVSNDLATIQKRIEKLVQRHSPLDTSQLPQYYEADYHDDINYKDHGFDQMKGLIATIPSIEYVSPSVPTNASDFLVYRHTLPLPSGAVVSDSGDVEKGDNAWLKSAIELWVGKALEAIAKINAENQPGDPSLLPIENFESRVSLDAELRPNGVPDEKTYIQKTVQGLRKDPRLRWEIRTNGSIAYWSNGTASVREDRTEPIQSHLGTKPGICGPCSSPMIAQSSEILVSDERKMESQLKFHRESAPPLTLSSSGQGLGMSAPEKPASTGQLGVESRKEARLLSVVERIEALVETEPSMELCQLPDRYKKKYKEKLNHKSLGFKKLGILIDSIPSIEMKRNRLRRKRAGVPSPRNVTIAPLPEPSSPAKNDPLRVVDAEPLVTPHIEAAPVPLTFRSFYDFATKYDADDTVGADQQQSSDDSAEELQTKLNVPQYDISAFLAATAPASSATGELRASLGDEAAASSFQEMALLGRSLENDLNSRSFGSTLFLNTHEPFCLAAIGVQGAGKSHTLACVLESCLLQVPSDSEEVIRLKKPMTALVLHYDQNTTSVCEAAGLISPAYPGGPRVPKSKATILVSPSFYKQRKAFYGDYCTVRPLLFKWSSLTADHIKRIMRIEAGDNQLYVASFMSLLRSYQRQGVVPVFSRFMQQVKKVCNVKGQQGPLDQRIALLESVVAESDLNKDIVSESMDLSKAMSSGLDLIIADLTDPLLSKEEANSLFQVVTEQFRSIPVKGGGKLLALDEAHKFMDGIKSDGLSEAIVNVARLMRHDGMRLAVSTQSPKALAPELLELVSVAVLHQFHSRDWWTYVCQKLPLPDEAWDTILSLCPGTAVVFASRSAVADHASHVMEVAVRPRFTTDFGASRTNK